VAFEKASCRKYSINLKGRSSISSCTLRDHGIPCKQCSMPVCKFPWKECNIYIYVCVCFFSWWHSLLRGKLHKQSHHLQKIENEASLLSKIKNKAPPPKKKNKRKNYTLQFRGGPRVGDWFLHADTWKQTQRSPEEEV